MLYKLRNKKRGIIRTAALFAAAAFVVTGCAQKTSVDSGMPKLDPSNPVNLTIWHYYNGVQQVAFDNLLSRFNDSVGKEQGIYVTGHSQGDVTQLEQTVMKAVNKDVGSDDAPNIFSCYADTAHEIEKMGMLADLTPYMTEEELSAYVGSYIEEGRIGQKGEFMIFPVAKSSEIFMLNKTDWDMFAQATGADLKSLETREGLVKTAQSYYEWTDSLTPDIPNDGKAFYGRDSMANLFIIGSMELGTEIFQVDNQKAVINVDKEIMKRIWEFYYEPFVKGYFSAYGRFRSDDMKIGKLIAYTGSSTSAMYFPREVQLDDTSYPIDYLILPVPKFEGGKDYAVQQGAGMVVSKGTPEEEYASVVFLKWFTQEENNLQFGCESGYLPVKTAAGNKETLDKVIEEQQLEISQLTYDSLITSFDIVKNKIMYTNKAFDGGAQARKELNYNLSDKAAADREIVRERLAQGMSLEEATADFVTEKAFESWFEEFKEALQGENETSAP